LPATVVGDQRKEALVAGQAAVAYDDVEKEAPGAVIVLHARLPALARKEVAQEPVELARQAFDDVVARSVTMSLYSHRTATRRRPTLGRDSLAACRLHFLVWHPGSSFPSSATGRSTSKRRSLSRAVREVAREVLLTPGQHYDRGSSPACFTTSSTCRTRHRARRRSDSHARQTAAMLTGIAAVHRRRGPQVVLVYGDTNSTLAGALAAAKLNVPIAHVEAGLAFVRPAHARSRSIAC